MLRRGRWRKGLKAVVSELCGYIGVSQVEETVNANAQWQACAWDFPGIARSQCGYSRDNEGMNQKMRSDGVRPGPCGP